MADLMLVSEDGAEVIQVSPKDAVGEAYGGFNYPWRIGEGQETIIAVMNPSAVEEVNFSLFLFSGGQSYTYEGGRLRPGEVHWVNIKELRDRRIPDQMGRLLPRGVSAGQAKLVVHGIAGIEESQRIIGEAILVDEGRGIRATMACANCFSRPMALILGPEEIVETFGTQRWVFARVYYEDGSSWGVNDPRAIEWFSTDPAVVEVEAASVSESRAVFQAELTNPGMAQLVAVVNHCAICAPCQFPDPLYSSNAISVRVKPKVAISGPNTVALGQHANTINLTAIGEPAGGTYSWSTASARVRLTDTASQIVSVESASASSSPGDVLIQVVYMMNGVVSDPSSITVTVQSPTSVGLVVTISQGQASCESGWAGWDRRVIWQVLDQFGQPMRYTGMPVTEVVTIGNPNTCRISQVETGFAFTNSQGQYSDHYYICSAACASGNCQTNALQSLTINGISLSQDVSIIYTCASITLNGQ